MLVIKKQNLFNLIFALSLILGLSLNLTPKIDSTHTAAPIVYDKVIVIDPGHGSPDGGAVGYSGTLEKDLNLQIAKRLGSLLQQSGAYVIYTREDDNSVAERIDDKIRNIKRNDMKKRKEIKNNSGADMFISIHMNKFEESKYSGAQVFYPSDSTESKQLAETIQTSIKDFADDSNVREAKDSQNSIFILKDSTIPSVLVECGFISNPQEEAKLNTASYQEEIAFAIYGGITRYLINYT